MTESLPEKVARVTKTIMSSCTYRTIKGSEAIYAYDAQIGVYRNCAETRIKTHAELELGDHATCHLITEIVNKVKRLTFTDVNSFDSDSDLICVRNGILNIQTGELYNHSSDILFLRSIDVDYDPNAECPAIRKFISEVVPARDAASLMQQFAGYMLMGGYRYHKAFLLVGRGRNGKTSFMNLLQRFIGAGNYSSLTLQQISNEKFMLPRLLGKIANISPEMGSTAIKDTEALKTITGESSFEVQNKNEKPFNMTNAAKMIFACNVIPPAPNADEAYYGRWIILPFPNQFLPGKGADEFLIDKITTPKELSGFLNYALEGLASLQRGHGFDYPNDPVGTRVLYQAWSGDTIQKFVATRLVLDSDAVMSRQRLLNEYLNYCRENDLVPSTENKFFIELPRAVGGHMTVFYRNEEGIRTHMIRGLRLAFSAAESTVPYRVSLLPSDMVEDTEY